MAAGVQPSFAMLTSVQEFLTQSAEESIALGERMAAQFTPPKLILLRGDLGAGKTTLTKGIALGFDAAEADEVTSPTFTLVHEYRGPQVTIYHLDLYRIDTERELATLGLEEMCADNAIVLIEWGEKFPRLLRECDAEIIIERTGEDSRKFVLRAR